MVADGHFGFLIVEIGFQQRQKTRFRRPLVKNVGIAAFAEIVSLAPVVAAQVVGFFDGVVVAVLAVD